MTKRADMNKGSYLLFIEIPNTLEITISGKPITIEDGLYTYVGSAMKNLHQRVNRHLSYLNGNYNKHWHIDNLLEEGKIISTLVLPNEERKEEELSMFLSRFYPKIAGFGATDCRRIDSNLYYLSNNLEDYFIIIRKVLEFNCNMKMKM